MIPNPKWQDHLVFYRREYIREDERATVHRDDALKRSVAKYESKDTV